MTDAQKWLILTGVFLSGWLLYLLALPVAAVIVVLLRYLYGRYLESSFYTP